MSIATKQHICRIVSLVGLVCIAFCVAQMVPPGMSGDIDKVRVWFVLFAISFIIAVPFTLAYYYYRGQNRDIETLRVAANTLGAAGEQLATPKPVKSQEATHGTDKQL